MPKPKDPTDPIRRKAASYAGVDEGTACTQSSFKAGKKAFLFVGEQGGRYKAMFKLDKSKGEALELAKKDPDRFQAGSNPWVTARFTAQEPMPRALWTKWLAESYSLSAEPAKKKKTANKKATKKKTANKKATKKKTANKKATKKKVAKKATKKRARTGAR